MNTKNVVAIGIGAALYAILSYISLPIGPNTSLRIAVAILVIFSAYFGAKVGFSVGFIGHALNDMLMYGSVWWSWVFLSAMIGLVMGLITKDKTFSITEGLIEKFHIVKMYLLSFVSIFAAALPAFIGDVYFYGEPADKVWVQIMLASVSNFIVIAALGIPVVIAMANRNKKTRNLDSQLD